MDYSLTDEQTLLADSVARFIDNDYSFEARRELAGSQLGFSQKHWSTFAQLGWLGVPFAEDDGGFSGGATETMLIMENIWRGLVVEPYLATVVLAGGAIRHGGSAAQKAKYLPGVVDGSTQWALAFAEPQARFNLVDINTTAVRKGDGYVLNGHKAVVLNGPSANFLVVSARTSGAQRDVEGVSLFVVPSGAPGLTRRDYPTQDGHRAAEVVLKNVFVEISNLLANEGQAFSCLSRTIDEGIVAVAAEAVGCMEMLYKTTVEYSKTRKQFGQPIGKFQVLQHRMVDMFMEYEQSKSLMHLAVMEMNTGYGPSAQRAASAFKVQVGTSGRFVGENAVQIHGGMGMSDDLNVGHYFKRLITIDTLFGNVDHHLTRFGTL
jgi:alkylation response protein AidB-like acyl-CoA dehydrogenase